MIAVNIAKIEERIAKACYSAGRKREEITLMAVSKFEPVEKIEEAFRCGIKFFGESRVKEAAEKFDFFNKIKQDSERSLKETKSSGNNLNREKNVELHMIGSLQRNKAKQAVLVFDCIQSIDRIELIDELVKHLPLRSQPLNILLEMHTGEESKSGFDSFDVLFSAAEHILNTGFLKPKGLMTMAPFTTDTELIRSSFRQLVKAQKELQKRFPFIKNDSKKRDDTNNDGIINEGNWDILSMGMSNDFEIAIEEGSTMLRIGSAIFKDNL